MQHSRTISVLLLLAGCSPGAFQEFIDSAPIRVGAAPDKFEDPRYGQVLVTVRGTLDGEPVSRIVASGGGGTPIVFTRSYQGGKLSEGTFLRCKNDLECEASRDIGATLIPIETWAASTGDPRQICVWAGANATEPDQQGDPALGGNGYVACEFPSNRPQRFPLGPAITTVRGDEGSLVFSGFGLPPAHPLGVLLVGVHSRNNNNDEPRRGGLYAQPDLMFSADQSKNVAPHLALVPLVDPATDKPFSDALDAADLGAQVSGVITGGEDLLFAVAQPSKQRVIVGSYDASLPGDPMDKFRVHACIESPDAGLRGFGERVLVGDLTGDGAPEIVVGTDPVGGTQPGKQALFVYDGRSLPGPVTGDVCPPWDAAGVPAPCSDQAGLACAGSAFGASLALGDVDADGKGDLIVGAPFATVGGKPEVGALWILPGGANGLDLDRAIAMTVPTEAKARFGWNVAALHTQDRDEPVASAPGVGQIFTVMCTPLERGFGGDQLCLD